MYNEIRKIDDKLKVCFISASDIQKDDLKTAIPELNADKNVIIKKPIKMYELAKIVARKIEED